VPHATPGVLERDERCALASYGQQTRFVQAGLAANTAGRGLLDCGAMSESVAEGVVCVPLTPAGVALIDAADAERILGYRWHLHPHGYAVRPRRAEDGPGPSQIYMHRVILDAPTGVPVRRRNESRLDNRRANLRLATLSQSRADARLRGDNTSGYRGVTRSTRRGRWQAQIQVAGKRRFLGYFASKEDAARAYDAAAREAFGEFARLNLPETTEQA
jgi:hypothetical protein